MKLGLITSLLLGQFALFGQDGAIERRFLLEKEKIQQRKIAQITESSFRQFDATDCSRDSAELEYSYKFDQNGNLIEVIQFHSSGMKITLYQRNIDGNYTGKKYIFTDKLGTVKFEDNWDFQFNLKNQIVKQEWKRGEEILRTNVIQYDDSGQQIVQTTDNNYRWTMEYDSEVNLVAFKEWRKVESDSFKCISITDYSYNDNLLTREVTRSAATSEIWKDFEYKYDSLGNLVTTIEKRTTWRTINDRPRESVITTFTTMHSTDKDGNVMISKKFVEDDNRLLNCTFFNYVRWTN